MTVAANPFTVVSNDTLAPILTGVARHEAQETQGGADTFDKVLVDEVGLAVAFGRGESDSNITFIALYNTGGTLCYIYPNTAGTGIIVSTSKP